MNAKALQYQNTAHFFHLIMTFITGGFWILVWLVCWLSNKSHNDRVDQNMLMLTLHNKR